MACWDRKMKVDLIEPIDSSEHSSQLTLSRIDGKLKRNQQLISHRRPFIIVFQHYVRKFLQYLNSTAEDFPGRTAPLQLKIQLLRDILFFAASCQCNTFFFTSRYSKEILLLLNHKKHVNYNQNFSLCFQIRKDRRSFSVSSFNSWMGDNHQGRNTG